jgi:histidinol-phosphate phosphatase family protein
MERAVFIDKDGTMIHDVPYNTDPDLILWHDGVKEALKLLQEDGFRIIVVSNQSGVAHGYFTMDALQAVEKKLACDLEREGIKLDGFYFCPHHPKGSVPEFSVDCSCRKPKPGMIFRAADDFNVELTRSWMIGDILNDVEAGNRAGCNTILIGNGGETEWKLSSFRYPTLVAPNMKEAVSGILHFQYA